MIILTKDCWNPDDAPTSNVVQHGTPALAGLLVLAQSETKRMLFGGAPNISFDGDCPTGADLTDGSVLWVRAPEFADRAEVVACASGTGTIYLQNEVLGTGVQIEFAGDGTTDAGSYYVNTGGGNESASASPSPCLIEMGDGAVNIIRVWKDTSDVVLWSVSFTWLSSTG